MSGTPLTLRPAGLDEFPSVSPAKVGYALRRWSAEHGLPAEALKEDILGLAPDRECGHWLLGFNPGLARWKDGRGFGFFNGKMDVPKLAVSAMADELRGLWGTTLDRGVIRSGSFDNWTPQGATVAVPVEPVWWQRTGVRAFGASLLLVAGPLLYWAQTRRLRRQRALQEEFSRQVIASQEEERKRIAGELHDGLGQNLWVAKNLALLGTLKPLPPEESVCRFREISEVLGTVVEELRDLSKMLRPAELDGLGLTKAIRAVLDRFDNSSNIEVTLTLEDIDGLLSPSDEINLYRLVQESLSNVLRHSRATQLTCQFTRSAGKLCVEIFDNGRGFDAQDVLAKGKAGLGLRGMAERARLMGGRLAINSRPGKGTRLDIHVPIRPRGEKA